MNTPIHTLHWHGRAAPLGGSPEFRVRSEESFSPEQTLRSHDYVPTPKEMVSSFMLIIKLPESGP